jgi:hypothetical protein
VTVDVMMILRSTVAALVHVAPALTVLSGALSIVESLLRLREAIHARHKRRPKRKRTAEVSGKE